MAEQNQTIFRKEALDHVTSPEQLSEYLRVTNPGIWLVLAAALLLVVGLLSWSWVGSLETTMEAKVVVENQTAQVVAAGTGKLESGMTLRVEEEEVPISSVSTDEYGRTIGTAEVTLPDGSYDRSSDR